MNKGSIPGTLSLLWSAAETNLARLNLWKEFHSGAMPVPILLLSSGEPMKPFVPLAETEAWQAAINHLFDARCMVKDTETYGFAAEAQLILASREEAFLAALNTAPPELARHLVWLPQFTSRIALLLRVTREAKDAEIGEQDVRAALDITRALGTAHLRTLIRVVSKSKKSPADAPAPPDKSAVMLAKIISKGPIRRRDLRRTYDNPSPEWFDPTLEGLIGVGLVRRDVDGRLVAGKCDGGGGGSDGERADEGEGESRGNEAT
jgi:hypothetical protein